MNFNDFNKVLFLSATIKFDDCFKIFELLNIKSKLNYNSFINKLPIGKFHLSYKNHLIIEISYNFEKSFKNDKCIIFFETKEKVMNINLKYPKIHGGLNDYEKNSIFESFYNNENNIILSTKIMSNGIDLQNINLIMFYNCLFDDYDLIQSIGRIRNKGLILTNKFICINQKFKNFYSIKDYNNHKFCCCNINDIEIKDIYI